MKLSSLLSVLTVTSITVDVQAVDPLTRLVDGATEHEGRVEIYRDGAWATICNDYYDVAEAQVICSELGFPIDVAPELVNTQATQGEITDIFGQGTTAAIWHMECTGDEASLEQCTGSQANNCGHHEDIGVYCSAPVEDPRCVAMDIDYFLDTCSASLPAMKADLPAEMDAKIAAAVADGGSIANEIDAAVGVVAARVSDLESILSGIDAAAAVGNMNVVDVTATDTDTWSRIIEWLSMPTALVSLLAMVNVFFFAVVVYVAVQLRQIGKHRNGKKAPNGQLYGRTAVDSGTSDSDNEHAQML